MVKELGQTLNQINPLQMGANSRETIYEECVQLFNIPTDTPNEALSYTENLLSLTCFKMSIGDEIDLESVVPMLDEENAKRMIDLYYKYYNF